MDAPCVSVSNKTTMIEILPENTNSKIRLRSYSILRKLLKRQVNKNGDKSKEKLRKNVVEKLKKINPAR